ncbi:MAG: hypothetical protein Q4C54_01100 [Clostridia bacterium]|nr:hypothetical protein [Clostridia bacterium]
MLKRIVLLLLAVVLVFSCAMAEENIEWEVEEEEIVEEADENLLSEGDVPQERTPRDDFIDRIVETGHQLYIKANGKLQRAHYSGDIYVCKNFTVYLFRENRDDFRMAEYPDVPLVIPDNLPKNDCKPYAYGFLWKDVPASDGNPFYVAAQFIYDSELSKDENMALAVEFMKQVRRGDYFQMSADYEYGVGAHSAIMISDYNPETGTVHWMDSNMRGGKKNNERYGMVQFDEEKSIEWWAKAFCHKKRGATLYRLRDDIIYAP